MSAVLLALCVLPNYSYPLLNKERVGACAGVRCLSRLSLPVSGGEADCHDCIFFADCSGIVRHVFRNGDRVAGSHLGMLIAERVFDAARKHMENLFAVRVAMAHVGMARFDGDAPKRHHLGVSLCARNQPGDASPIEIPYFAVAASRDYFQISSYLSIAACFD